MVQTSNTVGAQRESDLLTSNVVMNSTVPSVTSNQSDNFTSLPVSGVTYVVQQPTAAIVGEQQVCIPCSVYNTDCQEGGLPSGILTLVSALENNVAPYSHTNILRNVSTAHSTRQLCRSETVSKVQSGCQFVDSIPNSKGRKSLGTVEPASIAGIQTKFSSSPSGLVMAVSGVSGIPSLFESLSSSANSAVPGMVQEVASHAVQQARQK